MRKTANIRAVGLDAQRPQSELTVQISGIVDPHLAAARCNEREKLPQMLECMT